MKDIIHDAIVYWISFLKKYGMVMGVVFLFCISACATYGVIVMTKNQTLRVSFFDVGQGDAIFIQTPSGYDVLIDGGRDARILERLSSSMSYFDHSIDVVIATHPDADHVTGLVPVLKKYDVKHVVMSPLESETGIFSTLTEHIHNEGAEIHKASVGDVMDFGDGVVMRVLYPKSDVRSDVDTNDASVAVLITYGTQSVLLTGDMSSAYEHLLIQDDLPKSVTIYKAGHHGSKTSSGELLLSRIRPEYAVVSAGKDNTYGHPHIEAIDRLQNYSKEIISTIDRGTIRFISDGNTLSLETDKDK
jgi:competence protein ComEC